MTLQSQSAGSIRNIILTGLVLGCAAGCLPPADVSLNEIVPASGLLAYRGNPVAEAQLTFWSDELPEPAFALTDMHGKFRCMTNDTGEGIPPGDYVVTVVSPRSGIPGKYADVDSTPLYITIAEDETNDIVLELED